LEVSVGEERDPACQIGVGLGAHLPGGAGFCICLTWTAAGLWKDSPRDVSDACGLLRRSGEVAVPPAAGAAACCARVTLVGWCGFAGLAGHWVDADRAVCCARC
jgi:hypothetical protein